MSACLRRRHPERSMPFFGTTPLVAPGSGWRRLRHHAGLRRSVAVTRERRCHDGGDRSISTSQCHRRCRPNSFERAMTRRAADPADSHSQAGGHLAASIVAAALALAVVIAVTPRRCRSSCCAAGHRLPRRGRWARRFAPAVGGVWSVAVALAAAASHPAAGQLDARFAVGAASWMAERRRRAGAGRGASSGSGASRRRPAGFRGSARLGAVDRRGPLVSRDRDQHPVGADGSPRAAPMIAPRCIGPHLHAAGGRKAASIRPPCIASR